LLQVAGTLKIAKFALDAKVKQQVDKTNGGTKYVLPSDETVIFYDRASDDKEKDVIVLSETEDKLHVRKHKRTYIALRKSPEDPSLYYVIAAFVR
jgi:hypothetical protein